MQNKVNLLGHSLESLEDFFLENNESKFRAKQLLKWIHQKGILDFNLIRTLLDSGGPIIFRSEIAFL